MRYTNVDQALSAIDCSALGRDADKIQADVRGAFRPVLASLFDTTTIDGDKRDRVVIQLVESAIPNVLKTLANHWESRAA